MDSNQSRRESAGQILKLFLLISVVSVFIALILKDIVKALKRRAHWIPGDFLVLSAFTIQLLNLLSSQGEPLDANPGDAIGWGEFWMIHTSRVMLCVIVAYMMPGMANPGSEDSWGKLMALVLTIFLHVSSEYYIVHRRGEVAVHEPQGYYCSVWLCFPEKEINEPLYIAFATLISLCFAMLILLLGCANIAGRGIERIVAQKIPLVLKDQRDLYSEIGEQGTEAHHHRHYYHYHHSCCQTVVKAVLRAQNREKDLPHDHSCWQTVKDLVQTANMENEDRQQTCWRIVEDVVERADREKADELHKHSCWRRVDDALLRAEKVEEEHHHSHCQYCWRSVEDAVLKAWIVARAYSL
ncbi:hypothetical protein SUGI_0850470 [Cryptomeria japonica]|nr:hypothetical protein SUGI_0850470 [Cryptomeria japonica]